MTAAGCGRPRPTAACWWSRRRSGLALVLAANAARLAGWDHDFQGRPASWLRADGSPRSPDAGPAFLRRHGLAGRSLDLDGFVASGRPLIVTGHQPELFHPGVWIKNFAAAAIAGAQQGVGTEPDRRQRHPQVDVDPGAGQGGRRHAACTGRVRPVGGRCALRRLAGSGRRAVRDVRRSGARCGRRAVVRARCSTTSGRACCAARRGADARLAILAGAARARGANGAFPTWKFP